MYTLGGIVTCQQDIKKSIFRATAGPVADEEQARAFLSTRADPEANHNCWAYRIGQAYRFNDDGEPSGTAGRPILQALDGQGLDRVMVIVTRWFGGTLLGAGGLMRAYGGTAALCLRSGERQEIVDRVELRVACGFSDLQRVKARLLSVQGLSIAGENFVADGAELALLVPRAVEDLVRQTIIDQTSGRAIVAGPD